MTLDCRIKITQFHNFPRGAFLPFSFVGKSKKKAKCFNMLFGTPGQVHPGMHTRTPRCAPSGARVSAPPGPRGPPALPGEVPGNDNCGFLNPKGTPLCVGSPCGRGGAKTAPRGGNGAPGNENCGFLEIAGVPLRASDSVTVKVC